MVDCKVLEGRDSLSRVEDESLPDLGDSMNKRRVRKSKESKFGEEARDLFVFFSEQMQGS